MKVIIAGSRTFQDYSKIERVLSPYKKYISTIICGCASGADKLGAMYAAEHELDIQYFPANWDKYGKKAGYLRNQQMAEVADFVVVFWDAKSKGTKHMIDIAREKKIPTLIVYF